MSDLNANAKDTNYFFIIFSILSIIFVFYVIETIEEGTEQNAKAIKELTEQYDEHNKIIHAIDRDLRVIQDSISSCSRQNTLIILKLESINEKLKKRLTNE